MIEEEGLTGQRGSRLSKWIAASKTAREEMGMKECQLLQTLNFELTCFFGGIVLFCLQMSDILLHNVT